MKQRKYTLPRHTNLAKQGSRIGAFLVDFAIFLAFTMAFLFGCFRFILKPTIAPAKEELATEQINSHLSYRDENGNIKTIEAKAPFMEYRDRLSYFYMNYLTGNVVKPGTGSRLANEPIKNEKGEEVSKADYYTIAWFNKNVLLIPSDPDNDSESVFTYVKVDGHYDLTQLGVPKDYSLVSETQISTRMQTAYLEAYLNVFDEQKFIIDLNNTVSFGYSVEFVASAIIASIITYVVFPLVFKQGRTVGKKLFKLALASKDGYVFLNRQLAMRLMPLTVCLLAFLIPIWNDLVLVLLIPLIIFLVSFALAMASPKRCSLHDFTAGTIVIDDASSIIFENEMEEETYLMKEDGLTPEEGSEPESDGEEPELKYEK